MVLSPLLAGALLSQTASASLTRFSADHVGLKLDVIRVDLAAGKHRLRIGLSEGFPGTDQPFSAMVRSHSGAVAAINGAYFDKSTLLPIGDIFTDGTLVRKGLMGTALCIRADQTLDIRRVQRHRGVDWSEFESVLACGPALVLDGEVDCDPGAEGFRDPSVMGSVARMGVGYDRSGRLYLVRSTTRSSFEGFARAMRALGCYEAMNLDAGASRGFFFQGKFIEQPGRKLTNILVVVPRS